MPIPIFSFSPGQQQQVPQLSRKAKPHCAALRRRGVPVRVRRQALMVVAGGKRPASIRSLLVVVVALIAAARSSGPAGEKACLDLKFSLNFTMQKEDSPSHQNAGKCMEY
jgi:hypothetical protein